MSREDAFAKGLLGFYEGEIGAEGFSGLNLSIAYSYEASYEVGMGNFSGVGKFNDTLAEISGFPGDPQSPQYRGLFRCLFQARDWIGPVECAAIADALKRLDGCWLKPEVKRILLKHGWEPEAFAEYFSLWNDLFNFTGGFGAVNLF